MKVLLVNSNRHRIPIPVIPFGLCHVAAALRQERHQVEVLDLCFVDDAPAAIERALRRTDPDVVGVGIRNLDNGDCRSNVSFIDAIAADVLAPLRRGFPGPIVLGGGAVGINAPEILELTGLDLALRGDGEIAMVELVRRLGAGLDLAGSPGLVRRRGAGVVEEAPPLLVADLDALPIVDPSEFIDLAPYREQGSPLQVQTKRGCRLACDYCTYNLIEGQHYRLKSPERVALEVERLVASTGIARVELVDSAFNIPLDHAKEVLRAIIARHTPVELSAVGLNPGMVDEELAELLWRANFREVGLGAESVADGALRALGKNYSAGDVVRAIELIEATGIPITVFLILGGPGETRRTLAETFEALEAHLSRWNLIVASVGVRPYKGSPLALRLAQARPSSTEGGFLRCVRFEPEGISLDDVWLAAKQASARLPNLVLYGEQSTPIPVGLGRTLCAAASRLAPRQPVWRLLILGTMLGRAVGVQRARAALLELERGRRSAVLHGGAPDERASN
jgi:radical SAM superfamily enzyme YgiQ (UPF0313 family)